MISRAAGLEDVERRHHPLHRLVVRLVQRMSRGGGHHGAGSAGPPARGSTSDTKSHRCEMARDHLAEIDVDEIAVVVDHGVERVDLAQHAHDLELLLVQRVAARLHWTASGSSMKRALWNVRIVPRARRPGAITLRPPDQPAMKCGSTRPVAMRRSASTKRRSSFTGVPRVARGAEVDVRCGVAREMVLHPDVLHHPGVADHLGELGALVRAMQARRDEHRDAIRGHARGEHRLDHRPQEQPVGHGPRDVADQDARARAAAHELGERRARRPDGRARRVRRRADRRAWRAAPWRSPPAAPAAGGSRQGRCGRSGGGRRRSWRECYPSPGAVVFAL